MKKENILLWKCFAATIIVCLSTFRADAELPANLDLEKLKVYMKKTPEKCIMAFGNRRGEGSNAPVYPVYCIWDGVWNEGSIHEARGCMLGKFEADTGAYKGLITKRTLSKETTGKNCDKETVQKILNEIPLNAFGYYDSGDASIEKMSFGKMMRKYKCILLHDKYGLWEKSEDQALPKDPFAGWAKNSDEGYLYLKFGMKESDVKKFPACRMNVEPFFRDETKKIRAYVCNGLVFEGRLIDGEIFFRDGRLGRIGLPVGLRVPGGPESRKEDIDIYIKYLTKENGAPESAAQNDLIKVLEGKSKSADMIWKKGRAKLRVLSQADTTPMPYILYSSEEYLK